MGKITSALKKAAEERINRIDKITKIQERDQMVIKKIGESNVDPRIVTYFDPKALITEQYKILRTNILSLNKSKPPKTIVITSSLHSEGKTITSLNLAVALSQAIHKPKVLLVDADMRKGRIERYLGVDQKEGLSDILSGQKNIEDVVFHLDTENLTFISSGEVPENPAELLSSNKMKQFLSQTRAQFDFVIIDTPPIIAVTDSGIIGAQADGIIMVVQAGRTQRGIVRRAQELLYQSHSKVLGQVLTNIEYHLPEYIYRYL
ncbi:Tyrosine-protein kinase EpsD [hydrothermal vent metagenome]|uniref:non-specific protein-tyrosine kinase n=1 Tax=hydrothermal vent metagenome TaxID=652676 RepID=A0A3B1DET2_9ZZZZ